MPTIDDDAKLVARRFHEVFQSLSKPEDMIPTMAWDDVPSRFRLQVIRTFEELMRSEVIFAGPSLYAEP